MKDHHDDGSDDDGVFLNLVMMKRIFVDSRTNYLVNQDNEFLSSFITIKL